MSFESTLHFFTNHSESIIQWIFLAILLLSAFLISRIFFGKPEVESGGAGVSSMVSQVALPDGTDIGKFLQKVLDQTAKLEAVSADSMSSAMMTHVEAELKELKGQLHAREEELTKARAAGAPAGDNGLGAAEVEKAVVRIRELEAKLAEYEILEDDIADLSLYKDENVRLRSELEKLKGGVVTSPVVAGPAALAPPPSRGGAKVFEKTQNLTAGDDIVAEFAQAVNQDAAAPPELKAAAPASEEPLAEFEFEVNSEQATPVAESAVAPPSATEVAPAPVASVPAPASAHTAAARDAEGDAEGDDIFAEFAAGSAAVGVDDAALDTNKMMEEMADLVTIDPAPDDALQDDIDTDKMAAEPTRLTKS